MRIQQIKKPTTAAALLVFISACSSFDSPTRVDENFGKSVTNMIDAQIYDPAAANNPPTEPPLALDSGKAEKVLETYRKDISKPEQVSRPITIQIGQ